MDNNLLNLEWVTSKENIQHAVRTRLRIAAKGEFHGNAKLTDDNVRYIKAKRGLMLGTDLAQKFNVTKTIISLIQLNKSWKHIA